MADLHNKHVSLASTSMNADFTTANNTQVQEDHIGSMDIIWSGADATDAKVVIQASNDTINWCDLPGAAFTLNAAGDHKMFEISQFGYHYIRAKYTAGSNTTGLVNINFFKKSGRS